MNTNKTKPIRVALFDDHSHVHKAVAYQLSITVDIQLVAQGTNGREALDLCTQSRPDIVLMDVLMPGGNGLEATRVLRQRFPEIKILAFSNYYDHESVFEMLRNGATGYITKGTSTADLVETIRTTFAGKIVFSPDAVEQLMPLTQPHFPDIYHLTDRELKILKLLAQGLNIQDISEILFVSRSTVKFHVKNICIKMGTQTRSEALILAAKGNLI